MIFRKRVERAFDYAREQRKEREAAQPPQADMGLEKGDLFAMILSAFGVILPVVLVVLLVVAAAGYFFLFR